MVLRDANKQFADGYQLAEDVSNISGKPCEFLPSTRQLPVCGLPFDQSMTPYRLCFLGRWHPNKGIDLLLEALLLLEDKDWENIEEVRIAGGGPMENLVKKHVTKLQNNDRPVNLSGYQDKFGAAELLVWSDYVIIPSRIESIPVIFSDAMQVKRPVITMPVGDLPKLLKSATCGYITEEVSSTALADKIKEAIQSKTSMTKELEITRKKFNLKNIVRSFVETIN